MKNYFILFAFGIIIVAGCSRNSSLTTQGPAKTYAILPFDVTIEKICK